MKKILVPLTLSSSSHAALALALNLAQESDATVVLLHVVQFGIAEEEKNISRTLLLNELRRDAEAQLNQIADGIRQRVPTEIVVCAGCPAGTIVEQAGHLEADAIVMCSHGYRGWLKWLHRNTALHVLKRAPCAVWQVSPGGNDKAFTLTLANHSPQGSMYENAHPIQSLLQILFPRFGNAETGATRTFFTLNFTVKQLE
jgi:nucleotide-binding universal stress UspA family protein